MMFGRLLAVGMVALGLVEVARAELPPLIPRSVLFGNPVKSSPQISPDGKLLAYIAPDDKNVLQVWVRTIGKNDDRKLTTDKKRGIRTFFWTYAPDQLVYLQDNDGDENYHLYDVNLKTNTVRDLTPHPGVRAQMVDVDPKHPQEILVGLNLNDRSKFDVHRINLTTGAMELDTKNPGNVLSWTADADFKIRAAIAATKDGGYDLLYRSKPKTKWRVLRHWDSEEQGSPVGFSEDGKT